MYSAGEKKRLLYLKKKTAEFRCSRPEAFVGKDVLEICSKITGKHSCRSVISINLQSNFIEIALRHGCSPVKLLLIFRTPFPSDTAGWLLLESKTKNVEKKFSG